MLMPLLNVLGGLAVFIFGMKMMSDGLHQIAGEKMRAILKLFSANRLVAIFSGTAVTAVIQSSSASTVMVIGFVNAGLLTLTQAIGIIFGANIGTTVTAQLVAFDIAWIIMPAIILGVLLGFVNRGNLAHWGTTLAGFGFLFLGMQFMAGELHTLSEQAWFMALFRSFDCSPVNGAIPLGALLGAIGVGLGATAIIQSSSACAGIIIALGGSGVIDLYTAVALVLGSNIGTTVTALLAAIPTNRIARQAALAHCMFNIIGVVLCVLSFQIVYQGEPIFFYLIEKLSGDGTLPRQIANAHTVFNVATTLALTPFIPYLAKFCEKILPVHSEGVRYIKLEPHLLENPAIALNLSVSALKDLLKKNFHLVECALKLTTDNEKRQRALQGLIARDEAKVIAFRREVTSYLAEIMRRPLSEEQARQIPVLLRGVGTAEQLGRRTPTLVELVQKLRDSGTWHTPELVQEFEAVMPLLERQLQGALELLSDFSLEGAANCRKLASIISSRLEKCEKVQLERLNSGELPAENDVLYLELLVELRKISRQFDDIRHDAVALAGSRPTTARRGL